MIPSAAAQTKAPRHPTRLCMNRSVPGATAEPIMPEQVWKENTCGMRCGVTRSDRSA